MKNSRGISYPPFYANMKYFNELQFAEKDVTNYLELKLEYHPFQCNRFQGKNLPNSF